MIQGQIGSINLNQQYTISRNLPTVKSFFEDLLQIFGYIDFGMMFSVEILSGAWNLEVPPRMP